VDNNQKPLPILHLCEELLATAYSKSDQSAIGTYAESCPSHEAMDKRMLELSTAVDEVFLKIKQCSNMHQVRTLVKKQSIELKFFIFQRLLWVVTFCRKSGTESIAVSSEKPIPFAFAEAISSLSSGAINSAAKNGMSLSGMSARMIEDYD